MVIDWSVVPVMVFLVFTYCTSAPTTYLVRRLFGRLWFVEYLICMQCSGFWITLAITRSFATALCVSCICAFVSEVWSALQLKVKRMADEG